MNDLGGKIHCEHFANYFDSVAQIGILDKRIVYQPEVFLINSNFSFFLKKKTMKLNEFIIFFSGFL